MSRKSVSQFLVPLVVAPVLLLLFPMDLAPGRHLITFRADRFEPWGPPAETEASFGADCLRSYYPRRVLAAEAIQEGRIPLWDPYSFCGQPFLANFQSAVFYPPHLLLFFLSPERSLGVSVWLHLFLAGVGFFLLLRGTGVSTAAALVTGLLFATNGALAVRTSAHTMVAAASWIPWVLYLTRRTMSGGGIVPLALAFLCMILAGFPPILAWGTLLAFFWALFLWFPLRKERGARPLLRTGGAFFLGAALAAVQLLPTFEFLLHSDRVRFAYPALLSSSWHPAALIRFLVPDFFGGPSDGWEWIHVLRRGDGHYFQSYLSTAAYLGVGTLLFLLLGLRGAWKRREARFFFVVALVSALFLLGTPLLRVVALLPGIGGARVDRIVHVLMIGLLFPVAFGLERMREGKAGIGISLTAGLALQALLLVLFFAGEDLARLLGGEFAVARYRAGDLGAGVFRSVVFAAASLIVLLLSRRWMPPRFALLLAGFVLVGDTGLHARRCHVTVAKTDLPRETEEIRFLRSLEGPGRIVRFGDLVLPPNLPALFGIEDVAGYNALNIKDYRRYYEALSPGSVKERRINPLPDPDMIRSPLLHALNARWILTEKDLSLYRSPLLSGLSLLHDGRFRVYENTNPRASQRAYLAERLVGPVPPEEILSFMAAGRWEEGVAFFEEPPPSLPVEGEESVPIPRGGGEKITFAVREPERVVIDCEAPRSSVLVLADTFYPGWRATVDGGETEIYRVNGIFRGVLLPPGAHRVEFRYRPLSFRAGSVISLVSLLMVLLLAVRSILLNRRGDAIG